MLSRRPGVPELLIEIGFEEMPAPWLPGLAEQLRARFVEAAARDFLEAKGAAVAWTPRRLVLHAELPGRQADREEPVWGPALKLAKDAAGGWTKAAEGFARKNGVAVTELLQRAKDDARPGELNLLFVRKVKGREASELVPGLLAGVLRALAFPKRMSWDAWLDDGRGAFPFGRPIRWLVVLLDGSVVPFAIYALEGGGRGRVVVESGAVTRGHRFLPKGRGGERPVVHSYQELRDILKDRFVILEPEERGSRIGAQLRAASGGAGHDHGLRVEWRDLVEYPSVLVGRVPEEFHGLPPEVLETVLVHHQKYISLRGESGRIDRFAAVTNGDGAAAAEITRGMQRVVVARLRDAAFFLHEDRKRRLSERLADLDGVSFHQGLGTYRDKSARMAKLVEEMGRLGLLSGEALAAAALAARLAKADLVTLMVREFPELQGVMGGIYLSGEGVPESAALAVRWHYHPIAVEPEAEPFAAFAGKDAAARVFAAVALADKLDTLAGYFGIGESPTGSRDPYGLRRAGQGAVRAVLDFWRPKAGETAPDLQGLGAAAIAGYGSLKQPAEQTARNLTGFLLDRLEYVLTARGFAADEVAATLCTDAQDTAHARQDRAEPRQIRALADPIDALRRVEALQRGRREKPEAFAALAEAFKRAKNILAQAEPAASVDAGLFEKDAERALHEAASRLERSNGSYEERLRGLASLREQVGRFFDDVLVMAEDARVRANRLALLKQTLSLFYRIADISRLGGTS
jgi:glycyl-tRNA synthetase beta chain